MIVTLKEWTKKLYLSKLRRLSRKISSISAKCKLLDKHSDILNVSFIIVLYEPFSVLILRSNYTKLREGNVFTHVCLFNGLVGLLQSMYHWSYDGEGDLYLEGDLHASGLHWDGVHLEGVLHQNSLHLGRWVCIGMLLYLGRVGQIPLPGYPCDTVNKWAVCILLECFLVHYQFLYHMIEVVLQYLTKM